MKINLAYAPDDKYAPLALVSMISALENNENNDVEFIILYSQLKDSTLKSFDVLKSYQNCVLRYVKVDEKYFEKFPISFWVTVQTWYRTKIAELCPDLDRVLYLDCDTLVRGSLEYLFEIDLGENLLAGITDIWGEERHVERLNISDKKYFNAGVLLLNCKEWRKVNLFEKIKEYAIENAKILKCSDQDVLNKITENKKMKLHQKYDFMETWWRDFYNEYQGEDLARYNEAKLNPIIIHFTGTKPYDYECLHSFKKDWWKYARRTYMYNELKLNFLAKEIEFKKYCKSATFAKYLYYKLLWKICFTKKRKVYKDKALKLEDAIYRYRKFLRANFPLKKIFNER